MAFLELEILEVIEMSLSTIPEKLISVSSCSVLFSTNLLDKHGFVCMCASVSLTLNIKRKLLIWKFCFGSHRLKSFRVITHCQWGGTETTRTLTAAASGATATGDSPVSFQTTLLKLHVAKLKDLTVS